MKRIFIVVGMVFVACLRYLAVPRCAKDRLVPANCRAGEHNDSCFVVCQSVAEQFAGRYYSACEWRACRYANRHGRVQRQSGIWPSRHGYASLRCIRQCRPGLSPLRPVSTELRHSIAVTRIISHLYLRLFLR